MDIDHHHRARTLSCIAVEVAVSTHWYVWHDSFRAPFYCNSVAHDSFVCVTWRTHMCDIAYSYVWHDSFLRVTRPNLSCVLWCVTWLMDVCDMTHWCVWHDSLLYVYSYVWHDSFICVRWLIHRCQGCEHVRPPCYLSLWGPPMSLPLLLKAYMSRRLRVTSRRVLPQRDLKLL